jgi:site-specific DNA-methyltransferase (adenine-specific)
MKLYNGDCLEIMKTIQDKSIDAIITDPPYGTTACKWDSVIDFDLMWKQLNRIIKENGAIVLFGSEPFSSYLRLSNIKNYKYDWIWHKNNKTGFLNAKKMPLKNIETISIFINKIKYNPQGLKIFNKIVKRGGNGDNYGKSGCKNFQKFTNYPTQYINFKCEKKTTHPTQKPVELMEYLIKTYTNELETVLDFTMGSGTTGVACCNLNRDFIGIELDNDYFKIAEQRIKNEL